MEDKQPREQEEFTLEDIIREFSDHPQEVTPPEQAENAEEAPAAEAADDEEIEVIEEAEEAVETEETEDVAAAEPVDNAVEAEEIAEEPTEEIVEEAAEETESTGVSSDTIRLDSAQILKGVAHNAVIIDDDTEVEAETGEEAPAQEQTEPFTGQWEPEYEQPMGEYVPPQPIAFPSRAESREIKRKLVIGPEKKYYELTEKGLGKLQIAMFFTFLVVVLSAVSTVAYAQGMIPDSRLRLMIFGQCLAVLVSGLLGSFQLIQGVADLAKGRFTLNTLLVITFLVCCADGVFCLLQERIPCCAAFSLEVLLSLWSAYNRRHAELGQMDTLRKASRLSGVSACQEPYDGKTVLQRAPGRVECFMDNYDRPSAPEKRQDVYALVALVFSIAIGTFTGVMQDLYTGIQMTAVSLLAAVPATAFIATTRPFAILQRRLHRLGTVICGWQGVKQLCGKALFPLRNEDIFPLGTTRMNGVKFFGSRPTEQVLAYATALVNAEGGSLAPLFQQVLDSRNGRHYDATQVRLYAGGGIGGVVEDEPVLVGPLSLLKDMGVEAPDGIQVSQAVCVAIDGELCGVFAISYEKTKSATAGLSTLSSYRGLQPVMISGEFMMPESFIRSKFGIRTKRLLFPGEETRSQLRTMLPAEEQENALLVTMEGLAPVAFGVTGARALRAACNLGVVLHMIGGLLGMGIVLALVIMNALELLTPANMFLYQLVWMIPGLLVTEWTRSI